MPEKSGAMKLKLSWPEKWYLVYCSLWNFLKRSTKLNLKKEKKYLKYFHKEFHHVLYHKLTNSSRLLLQGIRIFFFSIWVFFHEHSQITGLHGKGEGIPLTPYYHFHPLHRHLDISRAITAQSSPLHIASSRTRTGNLWFPITSRWPLSYAIDLILDLRLVLSFSDSFYANSTLFIKYFNTAVVSSFTAPSGSIHLLAHYPQMGNGVLKSHFLFEELFYY